MNNIEKKLLVAINNERGCFSLAPFALDYNSQFILEDLESQPNLLNKTYIFQNFNLFSEIANSEFLILEKLGLTSRAENHLEICAFEILNHNLSINKKIFLFPKHTHIAIKFLEKSCKIIVILTQKVISIEEITNEPDYITISGIINDNSIVVSSIVLTTYEMQKRAFLISKNDIYIESSNKDKLLFSASMPNPFQNTVEVLIDFYIKNNHRFLEQNEEVHADRLPCFTFEKPNEIDFIRREQEQRKFANSPREKLGLRNKLREKVEKMRNQGNSFNQTSNSASLKHFQFIPVNEERSIFSKSNISVFSKGPSNTQGKADSLSIICEENPNNLFKNNTMNRFGINTSLNNQNRNKINPDNVCTEENPNFISNNMSSFPFQLQNNDNSYNSRGGMGTQSLNNEKKKRLNHLQRSNNTFNSNSVFDDFFSTKKSISLDKKIDPQEHQQIFNSNPFKNNANNNINNNIPFRANMQSNEMNPINIANRNSNILPTKPQNIEIESENKNKTPTQFSNILSKPPQENLPFQNFHSLTPLFPQPEVPHTSMNINLENQNLPNYYPNNLFPSGYLAQQPSTITPNLILPPSQPFNNQMEQPAQNYIPQINSNLNSNSDFQPKFGGYADFKLPNDANDLNNKFPFQTFPKNPLLNDPMKPNISSDFLFKSPPYNCKKRKLLLEHTKTESSIKKKKNSQYNPQKITNLNKNPYKPNTFELTDPINTQKLSEIEALFLKKETFDDKSEKNANNNNQPSFAHLYNSSRFCDVILKLKTNDEYKLHKVVLLTFSNYFENILESSNIQGEIVRITLPDFVKKIPFDLVVKFLYLTEFSKEDLEKIDIFLGKDLFYLACFFKIQNLAEYIGIYVLLPRMNREVCLELLKEVNKKKKFFDNIMTVLYRYSLSYFANHSKSILESKDLRAKLEEFPYEKEVFMKMIISAIEKAKDLGHLVELFKVLIKRREFGTNILELLQTSQNNYPEGIRENEEVFFIDQTENIFELLAQKENYHFISSQILLISFFPPVNPSNSTHLSELFKDISPDFQAEYILPIKSEEICDSADYVISATFSSETCNWRTLFEILPDSTLNAFVVYQGSKKNRMCEPFNLDFISAFVRISIFDGDCLVKDIYFFHCFQKKSNCLAGRKELLKFKTLMDPNTLKFKIYVKENILHCACLHYFHYNFEKIFKEKEKSVLEDWFLCEKSNADSSNNPLNNNNNELMNPNRILENNAVEQNKQSNNTSSNSNNLSMNLLHYIKNPPQQNISNNNIITNSINNINTASQNNNFNINVQGTNQNNNNNSKSKRTLSIFELNHFDISTIIISKTLPVEKEKVVAAFLYTYLKNKSPEIVSFTIKGLRLYALPTKVLLDLGKEHKEMKKSQYFMNLLQNELENRFLGSYNSNQNFIYSLRKKLLGERVYKSPEILNENAMKEFIEWLTHSNRKKVENEEKINQLNEKLNQKEAEMEKMKVEFMKKIDDIKKKENVLAQATTSQVANPPPINVINPQNIRHEEGNFMDFNFSNCTIF